MGTNKIEKALPKHIALIMDGNGRWAKKRLLPRSLGHAQGVKRMVKLMEHAFDIGVDYFTVYALSTENLSRPKEELDGLYRLIREHFLEYLQKICARGVRLRVIGDRALLPEDIRGIIQKAEADSAGYTGRGVTVALAYGSRSEIVRAVNRAVELGRPVTEESFSRLLDTSELPDPDLLIRTGKELRLSNFLLYQSAYTELYFSEKLFPDFTNKDLEKAIDSYMGRSRRYGKTTEQVCGKQETNT